MRQPHKNIIFSLEVITISFSFLIAMVFGIVLLMSMDDRTKEFYNHQLSIADNTTKYISREIEDILLNKKQLVQSFMKDNQTLISDVANNPQKVELYDRLNSKLGRYFTDYFSSNITTDSGRLVIDDFDGTIGELCITDLKHFVTIDAQLIRIHPNPVIYHYDILTKFELDSKKLVFIITFSADEISKLLRASTPDKHNLLIIDRINNLIEITKDGSRNKMTNRTDYRLTEEEIDRILSSSTVRGSYWNIVDLHNEALFTNFRNRMETESAVIYLFFVTLMLLMDISLFIAARTKNKLESHLLRNNKKIHELNKDLKKLSITDSLTNLYNRRYLETTARKEFNKAGRLSIPMNIALIDIDYFKLYNDTYGHQAGDECLIKIADTLDKCFMRSNEFAARYGGEEFIVINISDETNAFIERIEKFSNYIHSLKIDHITSKIGHVITVSIGVASTEYTKCKTVEKLILEADKALYDAKDNGRNTVVVSRNE